MQPHCVLVNGDWDERRYDIFGDVMSFKRYSERFLKVSTPSLTVADVQYIATVCICLCGENQKHFILFQRVTTLDSPLDKWPLIKFCSYCYSQQQHYKHIFSSSLKCDIKLSVIPSCTNEKQVYWFLLLCYALPQSLLIAQICSLNHRQLVTLCFQLD